MQHLKLVVLKNCEFENRFVLISEKHLAFSARQVMDANKNRRVLPKKRLTLKSGWLRYFPGRVKQVVSKKCFETDYRISQFYQHFLVSLEISGFRRNKQKVSISMKSLHHLWCIRLKRWWAKIVPIAPKKSRLKNFIQTPGISLDFFGLPVFWRNEKTDSFQQFSWNIWLSTMKSK